MGDWCLLIQRDHFPTLTGQSATRGGHPPLPPPHGRSHRPEGVPPQPIPQAERSPPTANPADWGEGASAAADPADPQLPAMRHWHFWVGGISRGGTTSPGALPRQCSQVGTSALARPPCPGTLAGKGYSSALGVHVHPHAPPTHRHCWRFICGGKKMREIIIRLCFRFLRAIQLLTCLCYLIYLETLFIHSMLYAS